MPTRLTRYILFETLKIFTVALIALTMLILVIGVARRLLKEGMGITAVTELLPYVLPISLQYALPATALFAVCCVYGRMASDGEISTVKSSGISPVRLMTPAFYLAALLSPAAVYLGDLAVSWGEPGMRRVALHSLEEIVYRVLEAQHSYNSNGFSISVTGVSGKTLQGPTVTINGSRRETDTPYQLMAREGKLELNAKEKEIILTLVDVQALGGRGVEFQLKGSEVITIPLDGDSSKKERQKQRPSNVPLSKMRRDIIETKTNMENNHRQLAAQTGFSLLTGRLEDLAATPAKSLAAKIQSDERRLIRLHTEPWRRWAGGFSCLCFVLVGAPLGIMAKTADYWSTFGMCFLPILLMYYPLFIFGLDQAKDGNLPPYSVWLGNVVLCAVAVVLIQRVRRY